MATSRICSIPGCGKFVHARGWCDAHYTRWQRHGDPLAGGTADGEPERYFREVVLAYEGDECLVWPYSTVGKGYAYLSHDGRMDLVSRMVCEKMEGPPPTPAHQAAHSCGKGHEGCVTKKHVRWATPAENEADKIAHGTYAVRGRQARLLRD